jgi:CHASE3 domain sensor protein
MKFTVAKKLGLGFGVVLALTLASTVLCYFKATSVEEEREKTANISTPSVFALKDLKADLNQSLNKTRQTVLGGSDKTEI